MVGQLGITTMFDTMEFMRKSWSQLNLPAAFTPTMDLGELDRRIKDLKAVEQWLNVNTSMLRSTIQALEVQRGTIAALQAFGSAMTTPQATTDRKAAGPGQRSASEREDASTGSGAAAMARTPSGGHGGRRDESHGGAAREERSSRGGSGSEPAPGPQPEETHAASAEASPEMPVLDPTAWWNLLQQQFQQVAGSAMAGVGLTGMTPPAAAEPSETGEAGNARGGGRGRGAAPTRGAAALSGARRPSVRSTKRGA